MSYYDKQKEIAIALIKDGKLFKCEGNALYRGKRREFVLEHPKNNLFETIRDEAVKYFNDNDIQWWSGKKMPIGHTLSSQVSCVNHLFPFRSNKLVADKILMNIFKGSKGSVEVCSLTAGESVFIDFEVADEQKGNNKYFKKEKGKRGANSTSLDALMLAKKNNELILLGIEWKYTENYSRTKVKHNSTKDDNYLDLFMNERSPFKEGNYLKVYYQPYYQMMRQTLLLNSMARDKYATNKWLYVHVIPDANTGMKKNTCRDISGDSLTEVWSKKILKDISKYKVIEPKDLFLDVSETDDPGRVLNYLRERYWQ